MQTLICIGSPRLKMKTNDIILKIRFKHICSYFREAVTSSCRQLDGSVDRLSTEGYTSPGAAGSRYPRILPGLQLGHQPPSSQIPTSFYNHRYHGAGPISPVNPSAAGYNSPGSVGTGPMSPLSPTTPRQYMSLEPVSFSTLPSMGSNGGGSAGGSGMRLVFGKKATLICDEIFMQEFLEMMHLKVS